MTPARTLWHRSARTLVAAAIGLLVLAGVAPAAPSSDQFNFQRFLARDGLPAAGVFCGLEDSRGFYWFGTGDSLVRFDGQRFRVFRPDPQDPESLPGGTVNGILEDPSGDLWMTSGGGLARWHRHTERFSRFRHDPNDPASLSESPLNCLVADRAGKLWIGTARAGLIHFDPRTGKSERHPAQPGSDEAVNDPWILCLFVDRAGMLWIGTGNGGLNRFDPATRRFKVYRHDPANPRSLPANRVTTVAEDAAGNLWVGTKSGLWRLGPDRVQGERVADGSDPSLALPVPQVNSLVIAPSGWIGLALDGGGFSRYDPAARTIVHHHHSPHVDTTRVTDKVSMAFQDQRGNLWLGHFPGGISHFNRATEAFQIFTNVPSEANTLSDKNVLSFHEDASGDLWVGTDNGGLNHWNAATRRWHAYLSKPGDPTSLAGRSVVDVVRDHHGELWVCTWEGGLSRFDAATGSFRRLPESPAPPGSPYDVHAWRIVDDGAQDLWIGTVAGGAEQLDPLTGRIVRHRRDLANPRSLSQDTATALLVTRAGELWAGTPQGLVRWNRSTRDWDRFAPPPGPQKTGNWMFDLLEDQAGVIWMAFEGGGLQRFDPRTGEWRVYLAADGLPTDRLRSLLQDDDGVLWIGSNRGLVRFDPRSGQVRVFDEKHGLPSSQFNPHARLRLASGDFLFGTTQGFIRFNPRSIRPDPVPARVVLTGFEAFNEPVPPARPESPLRQSITETKYLEIPARYSVISFQFAALGFPAPAPEQYRFKLEGFDRDWRTPGPELRATFTNLNAGQYRLQVRTMRRDGSWDEAAAELALVVVPPWWATWWFRSLAVAFILGTTATIGWLISAQRQRARAHARELAQERRRHHEFQALVENAPDAICRFDADCRIAYTNPAYCAVLRLQPAALLGRTPAEVYPGQASIAEYEAKIRAVLATGTPIQYEVVLEATQRPNPPCYDIRLVPERDHAGRVVSVLSIGRDISAIKETERQLRSLAANSPDIILRFDRTGRYLFVNRAMETATGLPAAEFIGRPVGEIAQLRNPTGTADRFRLLGDSLQRVFATGSALEEEMRLPEPGGERIFNLRLIPETDGAGHVDSVLVLAREVTARERAEAALRASEQRFRQVTENIDEVFWLKDVEPAAMIYVSPAYERVWGRTCASVLADPGAWLEAVHPDDRPRVGAAMPSSQDQGGYNLEYRIVRPDGTVRWVHDRAFAIRDGEGRIYRVAGVAEDITAKHQLEDQLRQAQKMESLGTLAGGIAHDFNNILTGVLGSAEVARLELPANHAAAPWLQNIIIAGKRARDLIQQIMTFGRKHESAMIPRELQTVVSEALRLLRSTIPSMVQIDSHIDPGCPPVVADDTQIHQVVMNLCTNAWHALPEQGGRIEVTLAPTAVSAETAATRLGLAAGPYVLLTVRDSGRGMPPDVLARIFEPFFTTKKQGHGTGLGLAVVHGIVQSHHGAIFVQSSPGKGTLFEVFLPALTRPAASAATTAPDQIYERGRGEGILLIDDDPAALAGLRVQMEHLGYRVTAVSDPKAALRLFLDHPARFSLVLTDYAMADYSGCDLAAKVLAARPGIPVLLASGLIGAAQAQRATDLGVRAILRKPVPLADLARQLAHCLRTDARQRD